MVLQSIRPAHCESPHQSNNSVFDTQNPTRPLAYRREKPLGFVVLDPLAFENETEIAIATPEDVVYRDYATWRIVFEYLEYNENPMTWRSIGNRKFSARLSISRTSFRVFLKLPIFERQRATRLRLVLNDKTKRRGTKKAHTNQPRASSDHSFLI